MQALFPVSGNLPKRSLRVGKASRPGKIFDEFPEWGDRGPPHPPSILGSPPSNPIQLSELLHPLWNGFVTIVWRSKIANFEIHLGRLAEFSGVSADTLIFADSISTCEEPLEM